MHRYSAPDGLSKLTFYAHIWAHSNVASMAHSPGSPAIVVFLEAGIPMNCPICRATETAVRYAVRGNTILACGQCGCWFVSERMTAGGTAVVAEAIRWGTAMAPGSTRAGGESASIAGYFSVESDLPPPQRAFRPHLQIVATHTTGKRLLDVGCATGHFLMAAHRGGYEVMGIDKSESAVAYIRETLGFPAIAGDIAQLSLDERFDVITLWGTIEHLARPAPALRKLRSWLRPGGVLIVGTGDNSSLLARLLGKRWCYAAQPDSVVYYSPAALHQVLEDQELQVDAWHRIPVSWVSSRHFLMMLLHSFQIDTAIILKLARWMPSFPLPVLHGTTMVAVARQQTVRLRA